MLPRLTVAAALALAGLVTAATPASAYWVICADVTRYYDEAPVLPPGVSQPHEVCLPLPVPPPV